MKMELKMYKVIELTLSEREVYVAKDRYKKEYRVGSEGSWKITKDVDEVIEIVNKEKEISSELLIRYLKRMCENPFISKRLVVEYIEQVLDELVILAEDKRTYIALMNIRFACTRGLK